MGRWLVAALGAAAELAAGTGLRALETNEARSVIVGSVHREG